MSTMKFKITHKRKKGSYLFLSVIFFSFLCTLVLNVPPTYISTFFFGLPLQVIYLFYALMYCAFFFLIMMLFNKLLHAIFIASYITISCIFLINDLRNPLFFILLAGLFFVLELLIQSRKEKK